MFTEALPQQVEVNTQEECEANATWPPCHLSVL